MKNVIEINDKTITVDSTTIPLSKIEAVSKSDLKRNNTLEIQPKWWQDHLDFFPEPTRFWTDYYLTISLISGQKINAVFCAGTERDAQYNRIVAVIK